MYGIVNQGGGKAIKSYQKGEVLVTGLSHTVNINAVDVNKSIVILRPISFAVRYIPKAQAGLKGFTSTSITVGVHNANQGVYGDVIWQYEVIEFSSAVKSVQKGQSQLNQVSSLNVPINSVDLSKSMVVVNFHGANKGTSNVYPDSAGYGVGGKLTTATNLNLFATAGSGAKYEVWDTYWFVVEFK